MVRPSQAYWAKRAASTPTWTARNRTTSRATSTLERGKRPSYCKHFSKTTNPRRVAPDLLPIATNSPGRRVKCGSQLLWCPYSLHLLPLFVAFVTPGGVSPHTHICSQPSVARGRCLATSEIAE